LFATTGIVLLGSFVALFLIGVATMQEFGVYRTHLAISDQLNASLGWLRDAEAAERLYLIRKDPQDLKAYEEAIRQLHAKLDSLAKHKAGELEQGQVSLLRQMVEGEVGELRQTVELRDRAGFEAVLARLEAGEDARKRVAIEAQINSMLAREREQLRAAQDAGGRSFRARTLIFLGLFVVNLAVLVGSYRRVVREAQARQAALNEARRAKAELEEAGRAKDQFLANLSHELRNPLTPVLAMLTSWQGEGNVPAKLQADVQLMRRNIELEARLIDDLLDLTRIAKGKLSLNYEVTDVHEMIHAALTVCEKDVREKRIEVKLNLNAARHHANVDPARLEQVLWNVLKNATKFTPDKGAIVIETGNPQAQIVEITIRDSGIGMSAATLARVFEPFEQGEGEVMRRYGGLGLGMAISKALVECQNGVIVAHSDGPGKGSSFEVTLGAVDAPVIATASAPASPVARSGGKGRRLRILLVEDHADTADVLGRVLRSRGHEVRVCDSVASATSAVQEGELDLLLSDIGLPDGTGLDLIRTLRREHKIPAIALTGYGMDDDVERCRDAGFDAHLTKPVSFEKLDAMIGEIAKN
jgi:signal transduction histidine kinase